MGRTDPRVRRPPSRTRHGLVHEVAQLDDGGLSCSCEAARHGLSCWHVEATCPNCLGGKAPDEEVCATCRSLQEQNL